MIGDYSDNGPYSEPTSQNAVSRSAVLRKEKTVPLYNMRGLWIQVIVKIKFDNTQLKIVDNFKYLGIVLESWVKILPSYTIGSLKLSKKINYLNKLSKNIGTETRLRVYLI